MSTQAPQPRMHLFAIGLLAGIGLIGILLLDTFSILQIATIILLIVLLILALRYKAEALLMLTAWLLLESTIIGYIPGELFTLIRFFPEIVIYALALSAGIQLLRQQDYIGLSKGPLLFWMTALISIGIISLLANGVDTTIGALGIRQIIRFILLGFTILFIDIPAGWFKRWWNMLIILFALQIVLGAVQFATSGAIDPWLLRDTTVNYASGAQFDTADQFWTVGTRVFGTLGRYDRYGAVVAIFTMLFGALALAGRYIQDWQLLGEWRRWYPWLFIGGILATIASGSRAAILALMLGVLWFVILKMRRYWIIIAGTIVGIISILFAVQYAASAGYQLQQIADSPDATVFERIVSPFTYQNLVGNYYGFGRTFWLVEVPRTVVATSPVYGVGPGQFGSGTAAQFNQRQVYTNLGLPFGAGDDIGVIDNSWFALWGEFGTLGLISMVALLAVLYRLSSIGSHTSIVLRDVDTAADSAQSIIVMVAFLAIFANHFEIRTTMVLLWTIPLILMRWNIGLLIESLRQAHQSNPHSSPRP